MERSFYARYAWPIVVIAVLLAGFIRVGVEGAFEGMNNNVAQWLPDLPETDQYLEFRSVFGADDVALISWVGCTLDDERLDRLAEALVPPPNELGEAEPENKTSCFKKVVTGRQLLDTLMAEPFELSREGAISRLKGAVVGHDGETTCAIVTLSDIGDADRRRARDALEDIAVNECGLKPEELRLGGSVVVNAAIDIEAERAITSLFPLSALVGLTVAWLCLRQIRLMIMIFFVSGYAVALGTAAIYYTGGRMNLLMILVPVLIYVLTLSASVHLANYYRDAVRESGTKGAPLRAVAAGWTPCFLASLTTALGVISLYISRVIPVKQFGIYSAIGVLLSLVAVFVLFPALLELFPLGAATGVTGSQKAPEGRLGRLLDGAVRWIVRRHRLVAWTCFLSLVFCGVGVRYIHTSIEPGKFLAPDSEWIEDLEWLEANIGSLVNVEVVLHVREDSDMNFLEQMELVQQIEWDMRGMDCVSTSLSAATFAPPLVGVRVDRRGGRVPARISMRRTVLNKRLQSNRNLFMESGYLAQEENETLWRTTVRIEYAEGLDLAQVLQKVEERVDGFLEKSGHLAGDDANVYAVYTGSVPLVHEAQGILLDDLFKSFCMAFVLIAIVMIILLRNVWAGVIVMLPNVFPAFATFGIMGWTGTSVDVGSMMTASVALGIAVDDTLHYLTWFRRAIEQGKSRREAIVVAYQHCAVAMIQTTLIAGLANVVFVLSDFQPVAQYGLLMFILLLAALVGDLVFLPAILATRLGELFVRRQASQ